MCGGSINVNTKVSINKGEGIDSTPKTTMLKRTTSLPNLNTGEKPVLSRSNSTTSLTKNETKELIKNSSIENKKDLMDDFMDDMLDDIEIPSQKEEKTEPKKVAPKFDFNMERVELWVNDVKDNMKTLDQKLDTNIKSINNPNGDLVLLFDEMKKFINEPLLSTSKSDIQGKIQAMSSVITEEMNKTTDPSKINTMINALEDLKKLTVNPRDKEVLETVQKMKDKYDTVNDSTISNVSENDFSRELNTIKKNLIKEDKEIGKLINNELSRGIKHYHVLLHKYPQFENAIVEANLLPELNKELSCVMAPALMNEFKAGKTLNFFEEMPSIVKFVNKFDKENPSDVDKLKNLQRKLYKISDSKSVVIDSFTKEFESTLKDLTSDDINVRNTAKKSISDMMLPNSKFLKEIKPQVRKEYPIMAEITKNGSVSEEKMYQKYMSKVNVNQLMKDYPLVEMNMKTVTDNFVRNLDILCERMTTDLDDIKNTIFKNNPNDDTPREIRLVGITPTDNDPHKGGQHGWFLKFDVDGETKKVVYKPRDVKIDNGLVGKDGAFDKFNQMLEDLSQLDNVERPKLNTYKFLAKEDYGYAQFVTSKPEDHVFTTEKEAKDFYYQYGVMTGLARMFMMGDQHHGNVIFHDKKPTLIDTEMSFNPGVGNHDNPAAQIMLNMQLSSFYEQHLDIDISNIDSMNFRVEYKGSSEKTGNSIKNNLNGKEDKDVSIQYKKDIERGMNDFLTIMGDNKNQDTMIEHIDSMKDVDCRFHVRATPDQLGRLREHFYSNSGTKGLEGKIETLEDFKNVYKNNSLIRNMINTEVKAGDKPNLGVIVEMVLQTMNGDVPYFTQKSGGTDIYGTDGEALKFDTKLLKDITNFLEDQGVMVHKDNGKTDSYFGNVTPLKMMEDNIRSIGTEKGNEHYMYVIEKTIPN